MSRSLEMAVGRILLRAIAALCGLAILAHLSGGPAAAADPGVTPKAGVVRAPPRVLSFACPSQLKLEYRYPVSPQKTRDGWTRSVPTSPAPAAFSLESAEVLQTKLKCGYGRSRSNPKRYYQDVPDGYVCVTSGQSGFRCTNRVLGGRRSLPGRTLTPRGSR